MAQKDKVKELVGRGLNSYHTKALQQMNRIEKKNKEQNHKISILSNELDNDYLTKTEEGSVISLEHSKEGMVYLDELQGNTLVNYCTDGSKEMTLNGDIDVEGTFVTTTEGVDNGKVDVMCEGNTLVNLLPWKFPFSYWVGSGVTYWRHLTYKKLNLVEGKTYSIIIKANIQDLNYVRLGHANGLSPSQITVLAKDLNKPIPFVATGIENNDFTIIVNKTGNYEWTQAELNSFSAILLEGDWTNKEIPDYFEGMKSVGECEDNKIEILSQNKNIFDGQLELGGLNHNNDMGQPNNDRYVRSKNFIKVLPNTKYFVSIEGVQNSAGIVVHEYDKNKNHINYVPNAGKAFITSNECRFIKFRNYNAESTDFINNINSLKILIEKDVKTDVYIEGKSNKKEISLNEPLRGLPNGIKDKKVKIGNKWYIERNCGEIMLNGDEVWNYWNLNTGLNNDYMSFYMSFNGKNYEPNVSYDLISDILVNINNTLWYRNLTSNSVALNADINISLQIGVKKSDLQTQDVVGFKQWLKTNKPKIVYKLKTPIYEPLEIEPTLNTYNDITHISNNSIIPCNMKIQNTGYNTIIKPSTLYTVALDTNKSGTIGMNLGGVKGTTTNNVLTLTTPATLADDSLRLYGKGIKGSKVRLLEGDKTNWIPSFFEGMKSSFEDKVQDDGSYKMEILSNNQNLVKELKAYSGNNAHSYVVEGNTVTLTSLKEHQGYFYTGFNFGGKLKPNTTYYISSNIIKSNPNTQPCIRMYDTKKAKDYAFLKQTGSVRFTTPSTEVDNIKMLLYSSMDNVSINNGDTIIYENIQISEVDANYVEPKFNKIQFSSIEPLRGLANGVRDRLCIKDNKLMIERNCGKVVLDGDTTKASYDGGIQPNEKYHNIIIRINNDKSAMKSFNEKYKCIAIDKMPYLLHAYLNVQGFGMNQYVDPSATFVGCIPASILGDRSKAQYFKDNPTTIIYNLAEPTYEEIPFELQKIILENYENGTLFFDTNIPPTSTVTYAGETPIVKATKLNKTEVLNNTNDINDNIIPYLMDMDYRVVCLQLQSEEFNCGIAMARLFGGAYEMLKRDIQSKRYSTEEYRHRLDAYLSANKITEEEYNKLGDMLNE